jgi:hypothetical protein
MREPMQISVCAASSEPQDQKKYMEYLLLEYLRLQWLQPAPCNSCNGALVAPVHLL